MHDRKPTGNILWVILLFLAATFGLNACGDVNNVTAPPGPAPPGPLKILTSSPLPAGTTGVAYDITLANSGGTPPYTWSLATGSPTLPNGLTLNQSTGNISGTPTATGTTPIEFKLQDSKGQSVQTVLSITVNVAPTPLAILTNSLTPGTINQFYAFALSPTGGTTPYTWDLKAGTPVLPSGLTLTSNGVISGTPTVTSNATHTFTLTDATSLTVEKPLQLSINAIPLSITTPSPLPQGTANQNYNATLEASGGTGAYTWSVNPPLPNGLQLSPSGVISGIPSSTSNVTPTFSVTDQTPPTPQTATKPLQLIIGAAPPTLTITTPNPLPPGTVLQSYNFTLTASGGTGTKTWDLANGSLPVGLNLSSAGVITGTPTTTGTSSPTFRVRDSGNPQQTATKPLSITISNPAPPSITTTSLPAGTFNVAYNQTVQVTGGIGTLVWGVTTGALPPGLNLNSSTGNISGTPTMTGPFTFTLRVTDQIPQSDQQNFTITINPPAPPAITAPSSLPVGTVTQDYPDTTLTASGGTAPLIWDPVVTPPLPSGLSWNAATHTISGIPLDGSQGTANHTFTVRDSTNPVQTATRTYSLTINLPAPPTITTTTLPNGTVTQPYSRTVQATGGTGALTWSVSAGSLPTGLNPINPSTGQISGTPSAAGTFSFTVRATDTLNQFDTQALSITIVLPAPPNITTTSPLPNGTVASAYSQTVQATGGTGALTWSVSAGSLPTGLNPINPSTGQISGTPSAAGTFSFTVRATDTLNQFDDQPLSITIDLPAPPNITTTTLLNGTVGAAYSQQVQAMGGIGNLTWGISAGSLPPGLDIDQATGVISGDNPTTAGTFSFTVQVTDTIPQSDTQALSITIDP
jgi:hypothetical protein